MKFQFVPASFSIPPEGGDIPLILRATPDSVPTPPDPTPPPVVVRAPSPIGYSHVWTLDAAEAEQVFAAGFTLVQAEAILQAGPATWDLERLLDIARVAKAFDGIFLITDFNWNGVEKEGWPADVGAFRHRLERLIAALQAEALIPHVWFEGVSEPDNDDAKCREMQRLSKEMWPGQLVGNGPGSGRSGPPLYGGIADVHFCSFAALLDGIGKAGLANTDCTPVLASHLSETQVRQATRKAIERRARLILYDQGSSRRFEPEILRWMTEELRTAVTPAPTGDPYLRWPNVGIVTDAQVRGIFAELLPRHSGDINRAIAYYRDQKKMTPAATWYDVRSSQEYRSNNPGAPPVPPPQP